MGASRLANKAESTDVVACKDGYGLSYLTVDAGATVAGNQADAMKCLALTDAALVRGTVSGTCAQFAVDQNATAKQDHCLLCPFGSQHNAAFTLHTNDVTNTTPVLCIAADAGATNCETATAAAAASATCIQCAPKFVLKSAAALSLLPQHALLVQLAMTTAIQLQMVSLVSSAAMDTSSTET